MQTTNNSNPNRFLFALILTLPSILFGLILVWQLGVSSANLSFVFLMILFSLVSSYFMWVWHSDQLEKQEAYHQKRNSEETNKLMAYTVELERMLLMVEPKLVEQVSAAKELTEQEIAALIQRFSAMQGKLNQLFTFDNFDIDEEDQEKLDNIKGIVEKIRHDFDLVLESLQFQDRVSQILALVEDNLDNLKQTVFNIQQQGMGRHQKMLKVEEFITNIQAQYETVKHRKSRSMPQHQVDEATFF
jgi:hypothetical protein